MDEESGQRLQKAKDQFRETINQLSGHPEEIEHLCGWIKNLFPAYMCTNQKEEDEEEDEDIVNLHEIAQHLRDVVPLSAMDPDEKIVFPTTGENADCKPETSVHVDTFLYDDDTLDDLVDEGKFSRSYCADCGSHNTKPLTFLSHSASMAQLQYIFKHALPDLQGKTVVDIGSRLGAVLYGGYFLSKAASLTGIELSKYFCDVQQDTLKTFKLADRIKIIQSNVLEQGDLLKQADVIMLNNVFEFFAEGKEQEKYWEFIKANCNRKGQILVTVPSIQDSFQNAEITGIRLEGWVTDVDLPEPPKEFDEDEVEDAKSVYVYRVI